MGKWILDKSLFGIKKEPVEVKNKDEKIHSFKCCQMDADVFYNRRCECINMFRK
jgi:hypothetical protein